MLIAAVHKPLESPHIHVGLFQIQQLSNINLPKNKFKTNRKRIHRFLDIPFNNLGWKKYN